MRRIGSAVLAVSAVALIAACGTQAQPAHLAVGAPQPQSPPATCPTSLPTNSPTGFHYPDAPATSMAPGTPDHATVCRYQGLNDPHPRTKAKSVELTAPQAAKLATALNSAKQPQPGANYPCPADFGVYDLVLFDYADRGPVDVLVSASGCATASNGHRDAMFASTAVQQLDSVVGAPAAPRK
jgi:hypothetical protein